MAHPLDGCRLKLARARTHYTELRRDIAIVIGKERDQTPGVYEPDTDEYVFRAPRAMAPKPEWSAILGDAIHNAHAALDYLVWELKVANSGSETAYTGFPIFTDAAKYDDEAKRKTRGVHDDAKRVIRSLQPFHVSMRDGHPSEHPLALLYELEGRDKHKTLNLTTNSIDVSLEGYLAGIYTAPGPFGFPMGPHEKGAVMARLRNVGGAGLSPWLEVQHRIVFASDGPEAAAGRDVCETLLKILHHIESCVLPPFARFFDAA